jgi:hypothetical protein
MQRHVIALIMLLAIGLHGSLAAFAAIAPAQSDCKTSAQSYDVTDKSCCPSGVHTTSCCSDACPAAVAAAVTASPASLIWHSRTVLVLQLGTATFFSRGDSPLTRPPIL